MSFRNFANAPITCHRCSRKGPTYLDRTDRGVLLTLQVNVSLTLLQSNIYITHCKWEKWNTGWDLNQRYVNPSRQDAMTTENFTAAYNIYDSTVWNSLHVTLLAPRILRWLRDLWRIFVLLTWIMFSLSSHKKIVHSQNLAFTIWYWRFLLHLYTKSWCRS